MFIFSTCFGRLCAHHQKKSLYLCNTWYLSLCVEDCLVCRFQPAYQTVIYTDRHSYFSWWWAHIRPKHVEKRNKLTKKNCAPSWLYLQDYTRTHGQHDIKFENLRLTIRSISNNITYEIINIHVGTKAVKKETEANTITKTCILGKLISKQQKWL